MVKVSIGLPVYNGQQFIEETLNSILSQTFEDFELIISDNASTDQTPDICKAYADQDTRIRYYSNTNNIGAARNYNRVFSLSNGQYFKWAPYDDLCAPTFLERCVKKLDFDPSIAISFSNTVYIDAYGSELPTDRKSLHVVSSSPHERLRYFLTSYSLCDAVLGLIRKEFLEKTNLIDFFIGSDLVLLVQLCLQGKIWQISEPLFYRRNHKKNVRCMSTYDRAKWFNPEYRGFTHINPQVIQFYKMLIAIQSSNIPLKEKVYCYPQAFRWVLLKLRNTAGKYKARLKELFADLTY